MGTKRPGSLGRKRPDLAERNRKNAKHNMTNTRTWRIWSAMRERCLNKNSKDFKRYGGRGIFICDEWKDSFQAFLRDMGEAPAGFSIDRIDNDNGYFKKNCRWADAKTQARNRRSNVLVAFGGQLLTVAEWAQKTGLERKTLEYRIRSGWTPERALTTKSLIDRKKKTDGLRSEQY